MTDFSPFDVADYLDNEGRRSKTNGGRRRSRSGGDTHMRNPHTLVMPFGLSY